MGNYTIFQMFENAMRGRQTRRILQQMFRKFQISNRLPNRYSSENCCWVPPIKRSDSRAGEALEYVREIFCLIALVYISQFFQNGRFTKIIRHRILIQTLQFYACLPTRQDGVENRDKAYLHKCNTLYFGLKNWKKKLEREKSGSVFHCKCLADT